MADTYSIPGCIRKYLKDNGFPFPYEYMSEYISMWERMYRSQGEFWDYDDTDQSGRKYKVHRRTIKPFKRVCREWSSLILGEGITIGTEDEECNEFLKTYLHEVGFMRNTQGLIQRAFGIGTAALSLQLDFDNGKIQIRRSLAKQIVPLSWDDDGVYEVALCSQCVIGGKCYDQLQMHILEDDGYHIKTIYFDDKGEQVTIDGVIDDYPTGSHNPWFAIIKPALDNDLVDMSPYGVSIYEDAVDALQSVDLAFDTMISEDDLGKMRVFLSDMMFEVDNGTAIPFGKNDATLYRNVQDSDGNLIHEFAPALRTDAQAKIYRLSLQTMGDLCGFGLGYFDIDETGGLKTATEVASDNSQLMRNLKNHENLLEVALQTIVRAICEAQNNIDESKKLEPGIVTVKFDDSIIVDTAAEKAQDLAEVGVTMNAWEFRVKHYGESEEEAKANVPSASQTNLSVIDSAYGI